MTFSIVAIGPLAPKIILMQLPARCVLASDEARSSEAVISPAAQRQPFQCCGLPEKHLEFGYIDRLTRGKGFRLDRNQVILRSMRGG